MASILLVMLAVELAVAVVNAVGAQAINNALWAIVSVLPSATSSRLAAQKRKQGEYLALRAELKATSSQDEFAKWAKLRRRHDKALEELERMKNDLEASRAGFDKYVSALRVMCTKAPQWLLPMWFAGRPVFWLPHGLFPPAVEWVAALPRAPTGSVSPATWQLACSVTLGLVVEVVKAVFGTTESTGGRARPAREARVGEKGPGEGVKTADGGAKSMGDGEKTEL